MDVQQLRYFVQTVERRSVSDAAKALAVTQPAVTRGLRRLEQELDAPLIERGPGGIRPTLYGEHFYRRARAMLRQLEQGQAEIARLHGSAPAEVAIGTTPSFVDSLIPGLIAEFTRAWPDVRLRVIKDLAPALTALVRDGELDVAFMLLGKRDAPGGLLYEPLGDMEVVFVGRRDHPLLDGGIAGAGQLAASEWLLLDSPDVHAFFQALFMQAGRAAPAPAVLTNSMRLIKSTVMRSDLIAFLPRHMVNAELDAGSLVELRTELDASTVDAGMLSRPGAQRSILQALMETARRLAADGAASLAAHDATRPASLEAVK